MATMALSGSVMAFRKSPLDPNVFAGLMSVYFVATAWATLRAPSMWTTRVNVAAVMLAGSLVAIDIALGVRALEAPRGVLNGVPFQMYFFLATVKLLAASGDVRFIRFGLRGGPRLARHLWRMCFALFIAVGSFFSIRSRVARVLPEPFTSAPMRVLPIVLVFGAMFYWLWRVRSRRTVLPATREVARAGAA
jgi:hypothetical protein